MRRAAQGLLAGLLVAGAVLADDVYLTNGEVFEGVVAESDGSTVRIRLPMGGGMTFPMSQVERIEEGESVLREFLRRREELLATDATAQDWLALGRWARLRDLPSYREVVLIAADLDPELDGLGPFMRGLGHELDSDLGRWIPRDEHLRRQGLVEYDGEWMTTEERASRIREYREQARSEHETAPPAHDAEPEREPERGPTDNEVALAQLDLMRDFLHTMNHSFPGFVYLGYGSIFHRPQVEGGVHPTASSGGSLAFRAGPVGSSRWDTFLSRQPGSFLPVGNRP